MRGSATDGRRAGSSAELLHGAVDERAHALLLKTVLERERLPPPGRHVRPEARAQRQRARRPRQPHRGNLVGRPVARQDRAQAVRHGPVLVVGQLDGIVEREVQGKGHQVLGMRAQKARCVPVGQDVLEHDVVLEHLGAEVALEPRHERPRAPHLVLVERVGDEGGPAGARVHREAEDLVLAKAHALVKAHAAPAQEVAAQREPPGKGAGGLLEEQVHGEALVDDVARTQARDEPVGAALVARPAAGSIDEHVRAALVERVDDSSAGLREEAVVGVEEAHVVAPSGLDPGVAGGGEAAVFLVDHAHAGVAGLPGGQPLARPVGGAVVDADDLEVAEVLLRERAQAAVDPVLDLVDRHDHREPRSGGRARAHSAPPRQSVLLGERPKSLNHATRATSGRPPSRR